MIEHELILLGLLKESPKHGYQIKKQIKTILSLFAGINLKSIYYPLRILEKNGLLVKHSDRQGKRPQRFVYKLTPKGQARFKQLLSKSLLELKRPQFSLDLSLYFLKNIEPRQAHRRLRGRVLMLGKLQRDLEQTILSLAPSDNPSMRQILNHDLQMVKAETEFLADLIKTI